MADNEFLRGILFFYSETGTEGGYWAFQDSKYISEDRKRWLYNGLHILDDGDSLKILSPQNNSEIVWSGIIRLRKYPVFTESVFNFWIHADQEGIDREVWAEYFFKEYPAELMPA